MWCNRVVENIGHVGLVHPKHECEVALTGFTGVTGFTRVLEAALLQQDCGYGSV